MGPGEEGYILEQQWMLVCRTSHDLWCLCGDFRQHFTPGCGAVVPVDGAGEGTGEGDGLDDIMVTFDVGEPADEDTG